MRFIHTADWHIGRAFRFLSDATAPLLQQARLDAVTRIGHRAREHGAAHVLIGGDLYDGGGLADPTLRQPLERMRTFSDLAWHVIPGNHDPVRPGGVWERVLRIGLPLNVRLHLEPAPVRLAADAWLLPAPGGALAGDPSAWMDEAGTPEGELRIGLAHGPSRTFGSGARPQAVVDPARVSLAGLDYLALGDWHGLREVAPACWYAGTPEPDRFDQPAAGHVLLVDLERGGPARVTPLPAAHYRWALETVEVLGLAGINALEAELRARQASGELERLLLRLRVEGSLTLAERDAFDRRIAEPFGSALAHLELDLNNLTDRPADDDLDALAGEGALRLAAERLHARMRAAADPEQAGLARAALLLLHRESRSGP